ncbi:MAG: hypothetical protein ACJ77N_15895, partial [Chloroflexota bacterium]
ATLRRFGPVDGERRLTDIEAELQRRLPADRWADLAIRGALLGVAAELVWGAFLDEHLAGAFRVRARERLLRGWEAAVDRSRYGPNAAVVDPFLDRVRSLTSEEAAAIVRAARGVPGSERPWPEGFDPAEHDGLRVSAALAARDAAAALGPELVRPAVTARLRRILGRVAHAIALRHLFDGRHYAELVAPWTAAIGEAPPGEVRRPRPRVRRAGA